MAGLVVKEKIRFEFTQKFALGQAAEEHRFINLDIPVHQRADGAFVRRGAARRHQRGANAYLRRAVLLQAMQRFEQGHEGPWRQRFGRQLALVLLKGLQPALLKHPLGLVGKQHCIAVKRDAHLVRIAASGVDGMCGHGGRRKARIQRRPHVLGVG